MTITTLQATGPSLLEPPGRDDPAVYTYYATDWRTGQVRTQLPLHGVDFNAPVSKHGALTGTYRCGRDGWRLRNAAHPLLSGILVCRDGVPFRDYYLWSDQISGDGRDVDIQATEWGSFFERVLITPEFLADVNAGEPLAWAHVDTQVIQRDLLQLAQQRPGQDIGLQLLDTLGGVLGDLNVNGWDMADVAAVFTELGNRQGGPEWAFTVRGDIDSPQRILQQGSPIGRADSGLVFEFVERDGYDPDELDGPPVVTTLDSLFPGPQPNAAVRGASGIGGNVIAFPGLVRDGGNGTTRTWAIGGGEEEDMLLRSATASDLLPAYPVLETATSYKSNTDPDSSSLQAHADGDLAARRGLTITAPVATFDDWPNVAEVQRGDDCLLSIASDMFNPNPYELRSRVLDLAVKPDDDGGYAQVTYVLSSVQKG